MGTAALDLAGKIVWRQTEVKYTPIHGNGGSPILTDGLLVFSCDGAQDPFVTALDAANGDVRWKTPRQSPAKKQHSRRNKISGPKCNWQTCYGIVPAPENQNRYHHCDGFSAEGRQRSKRFGVDDIAGRRICVTDAAANTESVGFGSDLNA